MSQPKGKSKSDLKEVQRCPSCGSSRLVRDYEKSEIVCTDCGDVLVRRIPDLGREWNAFNEEQWEKRARAGAPLTYTIHDKGLSTVIDWHDRDSRGNRISLDQKSQIWRLRRWQRRIRLSDRNERNLAFGLSEIRKVADNLSLPRSVFETASVIYRKTVKKRLVRGRSIRGVSAATVYLACRQCRLAWTLNEVAEASNMEKKDLGRNYRFLVRKLNCFIPPTKPSQYVSKLSNHLATQGKVEEIANEILKAARKLRITSGRGPVGLAAAAIYIASVLVGERRSQTEISQVANVTEVTVRNRYKELAESLVLITTL